MGRTELRQLDESWSPWTWQVLTFGDAQYYGYRESREIVTGQSNFTDEQKAREYYGIQGK